MRTCQRCKAPILDETELSYTLVERRKETVLREQFFHVACFMDMASDFADYKLGLEITNLKMERESLQNEIRVLKNRETVGADTGTEVARIKRTLIEMIERLPEEDTADKLFAQRWEMLWAGMGIAIQASNTIKQVIDKHNKTALKFKVIENKVKAAEAKHAELEAMYTKVLDERDQALRDADLFGKRLEQIAQLSKEFIA